MKNKTRARVVVLAIIVGVIVLGYWVGPKAFALFLAMHGIS